MFCGPSMPISRLCTCAYKPSQTAEFYNWEYHEFTFEFSGIPSMLQTKTSLYGAVLVSSPWNILQLIQMTDTSTS